MEPLIRRGAKLVINMSPVRYSVGDIVLFFRHNKPSAHRIILSNGKTVKRYLTKGDNNPYVDEWIAKRQIVGRIETIVYPSYVIDLRHHENFLSYIFLVYSWCTIRCPFLLRWGLFARIMLFKKLYRLILLASGFRLTAFHSH